MSCKICIEKPVIKLPNSEVSLCKKCYIRYFENKVKKTITNYRLIEKNDHLVIACSGGKDSTTLLYLIRKITSNRRDIKITALAIDEGIHGYRNESLKFLKEFCKNNEINLEIYSYEKEFGKSLDAILKTYTGIPCSICGVLRRYLLNKKSKDLKATKLATGHNLDDEAQSIMMNYFRNNIRISARMGPKTGILRNPKFIPRIKPLYLLTEKEVTAYAFLKGFMDKFNECPNSSQAYRNEIRNILNNLENKYPGTKHCVVESFLETLPLLREHYKSEKSLLKTCIKCDELSSKDICKTCELVAKIIKE